jgi:SpoIID/LytB domain protein
MKGSNNPEVHVGILLADQVRFWLEGDFRSGEGDLHSGEAEAFLAGGRLEVRMKDRIVARGRELFLQPLDIGRDSFGIHDVVIGIGFHWEQKEDQLFSGSLKLTVEAGRIRAINLVPVEDYLVSVISSEMRGDSHPELLRAHTLISRSWLLAQVEKQEELYSAQTTYRTVHESEEEYIRWYDREDHQDFHVCADDHCQRYQGKTRAYNPAVVAAVRETMGEVITHGGRICDARFSKCCGGVTEKFEHCWEPKEHPYLLRVADLPDSEDGDPPDLKEEQAARSFILAEPEAFCNTRDAQLLRTVLNDYDQSSRDFYRWTVRYSQEELADLIRQRSGIDFGHILDLVPVERGESGRLVRLRIIGSKTTMVVGKELEIRRWLSTSHLYSSAFVVQLEELQEGVPQAFVLRGAGWGHGVGLCQIGAAVMASRGYDYGDILAHYFRNARIEKRYE